VLHWVLGAKRAPSELAFFHETGAAQQAVAAVAVAAAAVAAALALAESAAAAGAEAVAELRRQGFSVSARGRVRKLAPSGGCWTAGRRQQEAVAREGMKERGPNAAKGTSKEEGQSGEAKRRAGVRERSEGAKGCKRPLAGFWQRHSSLRRA
jgi:hypothetical protein